MGGGTTGVKHTPAGDGYRAGKKSVSTFQLETNCFEPTYPQMPEIASTSRWKVDVGGAITMTIRSAHVREQTRVEEIGWRRAIDNCPVDKRRDEKIENVFALVLLERETKKQTRWRRGVELVTKQSKLKPRRF